jgi:hypothetical protein
MAAVTGNQAWSAPAQLRFAPGGAGDLLVGLLGEGRGRGAVCLARRRSRPRPSSARVRCSRPGAQMPLQALSSFGQRVSILALRARRYSSEHVRRPLRLELPSALRTLEPARRHAPRDVVGGVLLRVRGPMLLQVLSPTPAAPRIQAKPGVPRIWTESLERQVLAASRTVLVGRRVRVHSHGIFL